MTRSPAPGHADPDPQIRLLQEGRLDFSGALLVATRLVREISNRPAAADRNRIATLAAALDMPAYQHQKQAYFLYREIAVEPGAGGPVDGAPGFMAQSF